MPEQPAFPDDIPTAPLVHLSLSKLLSYDREESSRFFSVCKSLGFFYLQLDTPSGRALDGEAERLFTIGEQLFFLGDNRLTAPAVTAHFLALPFCGCRLG